jgi:cardiolipin synthase
MASLLSHPERLSLGCGLVAMLVLLPGCRTRPARLGPCGRLQQAGCPCTCQDRWSREARLFQQVSRDTSVELVSHPARAGRLLLTGPIDFLENASRDLIGKRLGLNRCHPGKIPQPPWTPSPSPDHPACIQLYSDGPAALLALEEVIASAQHRLDVLMYTWDQSALGLAIARRIAAQAGPCLPVRVLVDEGGNLVFGKPDSACAGEVNRALCWLASQPHVTVIRTRTPFMRFDHRKLVLADGWLAWTGGRNFTENDFQQRRDLTFTVTGPLVGQMQECFEECWREQGDSPRAGVGEPGQAAPGSPTCSEANVRGRLVQTTPTRHELKRALYQALEGAEKSIWLENPYLSDSGMVNKMVRACQRGVEVSVVLSITGDARVVNRANRVTANRLLRAGAKVYLHPGSLHTKAALVDGQWAYLGTGNFDTLSLRRNREMGLILVEGPLLAEMANRVFLPDFEPAWQLRAPLPVSIGDRACELLASLFL